MVLLKNLDFHENFEFSKPSTDASGASGTCVRVHKRLPRGAWRILRGDGVFGDGEPAC